MDDVGRLEVLEQLYREAVKVRQRYWQEKAEAQTNEARYLWLRDVWWHRRTPRLTEYDRDELDAAIDAYRQGKTPAPPRRAIPDE